MARREGPAVHAAAKVRHAAAKERALEFAFCVCSVTVSPSPAASFLKARWVVVFLVFGPSLSLSLARLVVVVGVVEAAEQREQLLHLGLPQPVGLGLREGERAGDCFLRNVGTGPPPTRPTA